jgi:transcriptional regulator with XRE-family HTH domain
MAVYKARRRTSKLPERTYLIEARIEAEKTQDEIIDLLREKGGMIFNRSTLARWESGKRKPDVEVLTAYADIFGWSMDDVSAWETKYLRDRRLCETDGAA